MTLATPMSLPIVPIGPISGALAAWLIAIAKGKKKGNRGAFVATGALVGLGAGVYNFWVIRQRHPDLMARASNPEAGRQARRHARRQARRQARRHARRHARRQARRR